MGAHKDILYLFVAGINGIFHFPGFTISFLDLKVVWIFQAFKESILSSLFYIETLPNFDMKYLQVVHRQCIDERNSDLSQCTIEHALE
jgi:hypothetical protein